MNYPQIGNEIDNLGYAELEADYRAHKHGMGCCWIDTIVQVLMTIGVCAGIALVIWLAIGVYGQVDAAMQGYNPIGY
jgi:hypothetical protein